MPMLSSMAQHLSHLLAANLLQSNPSPPHLRSTYICIKVLQHFIFLAATHTCVCARAGVGGVLRAQGWRRQPSHSAQLAALSSLSVHLSLCSLLPPSSCSPSRPISQPSHTQLALLHCSGLPSKTQLSS